MQDQISKKQNFLYKEIIEGGYHPEEFQQFLIAYNDQVADNLDQWSIEELKVVVYKFKESRPLEEKEEVIDKKEEEKKQEQPLEKVTEKEEDKNEGKYSVTIQCLKKKPVLEFINLKLDIKILKYNKKQGGLFEKSYVTYEILVEPLHIKVERRYSDFQWLKEKLNFLYPGFPVPPISKKGQYRRYDEKHLTKRIIILQKFLNKIVTIPELKSDELVHEFLTLKQTPAFEKFKSKYKGLTSQVEMTRMSNLEGEVTLCLNKNLSTFLLQTQKYLAQVQPCVKKIYKDFKACATSLESCSETFKSIGTNCKNIWNYDHQFRTELKLPLLQNNLYSNFQAISEQYSQLLLKQATLLRNEMYGLVKYESLFMINLMDSLQGLADKQQKFNDVRINLLKRKIKLYELGDVSKWGCQVKITEKPKTKQEAFGLMLIKQTTEAKKMRDVYALYNQQIFKESQRYFRQTNRNIARYVKDYIESQSKLNSEGMMLWADMLSNAMGMQEDKNIKHTFFL